jgi:hypothetical protein
LNRLAFRPGAHRAMREVPAGAAGARSHGAYTTQRVVDGRPRYGRIGHRVAKAVRACGCLIDALRHAGAGAWRHSNRHRLPTTRIHRTRSSGLHLLFQHRPGMRCWTGCPDVGVDGRADGGYVIWWPVAGEPLICDAPPAQWPDWSLEELIPQTAPAFAGAWEASAALFDRGTQSCYTDAALRHATERVARAPVGTRNDVLNSEAYSLGRLVAAGLIDGQAVADALAAAAMAAGLLPREIEATLRSAFGARGLL